MHFCCLALFLRDLRALEPFAILKILAVAPRRGLRDPNWNCGLVWQQLDRLADQNAAGQWMIHLGFSGAVLNLFSLLAAVLALVNLESTFRAAIGTMLWRIKFIILGLGLIFIVRAYVNGQALLFHNTLTLSLQSVSAMGTLFGAALSVRSLFRPGHFETNVYPSKIVLRTSLILVLAGVYFFVVGVFAKLSSSLAATPPSLSRPLFFS